MRYDKRVLTFTWGNNEARDEYTNSTGFVISPNLYRHDIAYLVELAEEAKRDFPGLSDNDIEAFRVTKSRYNAGFWGVKFRLPANTAKEGYRIVSELDFSHC